VVAADPALAPDDAGVVEFPVIGGSPPSAVVGGEVAVVLSTSPGAGALVEFLATPEAAGVWAALGGFTSPNRNVDASTYKTDGQRRAAAALVGAEVVRYDMSDFQPVAFGAAPTQGLWPLFAEYLADTSKAADVAQRMEKTASGIFEP
ncbi:MAG: carbohydrate ABC transporter substrate-binding protein, partial [Acidimicrobiia bacterium]